MVVAVGAKLCRSRDTFYPMCPHIVNVTLELDKCPLHFLIQPEKNYDETTVPYDEQKSRLFT